MSRSAWSDEEESPLRNIKVVDLSIMLTGPMVTRLLAQYGADVVKVEKHPTGDPLRALSRTQIFPLLNTGKKSLSLNFEKPEAIALIKKLVAEADVFVENFREGVMERLGLDYADLSEINPNLLYVSLRGMSGKQDSLPGHDMNFIANSGVGEWFLDGGRGNHSTFFGDIVGGVLAPLTKILAQLANPNRRGMHLMSYMDQGFRTLYIPRAFDAAMGESAGVMKDFTGHFPHSKYYQCKDGEWVALQAVQKKHWDIFCDKAGVTPWKSRHEDKTLIPELESLFKSATAGDWEEKMQDSDSCLTRVVPFNEAMDSILKDDPFAWCGFQPNQLLKSSPAVGEDTYSVLTSLNLDNKQISALLSQETAFDPARR